MPLRQPKPIALTLLLAAGLSSTGCTLFENSFAIKQVYPLEGNAVAELYETEVRNPASGDPGRNYRRLELHVRQSAGGRAVNGGVVCHRVLLHCIGAGDVTPSHADELVLRGNEDRSQLWLVDRGLGRVIAALDRQTNTFTGINDPIPAWATHQSGEILRRAEEPEKDKSDNAIASAALKPQSE